MKEQKISRHSTLLRLWHRMLGDPAAAYRRGIKRLVPLIYRIRYIGFDEHIPAKGPALLICNHVTYMDGLVIDSAVGRPVRFIIDSEIYKISGVHYFMEMGGAIPISPTRESVEAALEQVSLALQNGELVCIFPEGQLTYTGNLGRFKFGIEWMLKDNPVPVVPLVLKGLWGSILSRKYRRSTWRWFPRRFRRKVTIACGAPIAPEDATISHLQRTLMQLKNGV